MPNWQIFATGVSRLQDGPLVRLLWVFVWKCEHAISFDYCVAIDREALQLAHIKMLPHAYKCCNQSCIPGDSRRAVH
jgi:hypothetical protein